MSKRVKYGFFFGLMVICTCLFGQAKNEEMHVFDDLQSTTLEFAESASPSGDSITNQQLDQLNLQLSQLNIQFADYRNAVSVFGHRQQSAIIQELIGTTAITTGIIMLTNRHNPHNDAAYVPIVAGGVLCISGMITWICSYTPLARSKVKVTPSGVVYNF
jgi:glycerol uptake facilitator-like aquaporin